MYRALAATPLSKPSVYLRETSLYLCETKVEIPIYNTP